MQDKYNIIFFEFPLIPSKFFLCQSNLGFLFLLIEWQALSMT